MKTIKKVTLVKSIVTKKNNLQTLSNPVGSSIEPDCRSTSLSQLQH